MDLGLKGPALASALSELEGGKGNPQSGEGVQVEFSALLILYSRHAGLRAPPHYSSNQLGGTGRIGTGGKGERSLWVPTSTGQWEEVCIWMAHLGCPVLE